MMTRDAVLAAADAMLAEAATVRRAPLELVRADAPRVPLRADATAADLYLYGGIGGFFGISANDVVAELRAIGPRPVHVHVNSPGGDVFDGLAIFNTLRRHPAPVTITVEGLAASIASIIALAGTSLRMATASLLMIHEPHAVAVGPAEDMRYMAALLDQTAGMFADLYVAQTAAARDDVVQWMRAETWFTPAEALDAKLIDAIDDGALSDAARTVAASFDLTAFRHAPPLPAAAPVPDPPRPPLARERAALVAHVLYLLAGERSAA